MKAEAPETAKPNTRRRRQPVRAMNDPRTARKQNEANKDQTDQ